MFDFIISELMKLIGQVLSVLQKLNALLLENFGGVLLLISSIAAIFAWRSSKRHRNNEDVLEKLAEAIIRQHNRELREK